jgi:drug/metabolite transporter (DMT)-like permease
MPPGQANGHLAGILLMSAAVLLFSINDVLGKWLVATYSVAQVLVLRSIAALVVLAPMVGRDGMEHLLRPRRIRIQIARVACGTLEVGCFYWAVSMMPLADTMAFWMATPIFVAVASAVVLRERLEPVRFAAVVLGFLGVLLALGAGLDSGWLPIAVALFGCASTPATSCAPGRCAAPRPACWPSTRWRARCCSGW